MNEVVEQKEGEVYGMLQQGRRPEHDLSDISHYNLDEVAALEGDIGLAKYVIKSVPYNTYLVELIDIHDGLKKEGNFYMSNDDSDKSWRYGRICLAPKYSNTSIEDEYSVGDIVVFHNTKGLDSGICHYYAPDKSVKKIKHGRFLSYGRIFAKVEPLLNNSDDAQ